MIEEYRTPARASEHEIPKIKGSRFIARAAPVAGEAEAETLVAAARRDHPDARHHCSAWRLRPEGAVFRADDDGEPSGSAGRPILREIEGRGLVDAAVVVVRYFGGVKLGVGGLVRAYAAAAAGALEAAGVRTVAVTRRVRVTHGYELSGAVSGAAAAMGLAPEASEYGAEVRVEFEVPVARLDAFLREIADRTAGQATVEVMNP
jgi:uncharacterized YigZ family protein